MPAEENVETGKTFKKMKKVNKAKKNTLKNDCDGILLLVAMRALLCPGTDPKCSGPLGELLYTEYC